MSPTGAAPNGLHARYAMRGSMSGVGAKTVRSDLNGLFFCAFFAHGCCQKITPLIFCRSTKFTPTGVHISAE